MKIRPIVTEDDYDAAIDRITLLMPAVPGSAAGEELDVLATLAVAYEVKHFSMEAPDAITAIEFRMEQQGLSRKDLEPLIGSRARVSEVLSGKRQLTIAMIRRLHAGLGISADVLIGLPKGAATAKMRKSDNSKSPQEKKALSLKRDRRNTYGENAKSSRKNIPLGKRLSQRAMRRAANTPLQSVFGRVDEEMALSAEGQSRTMAIKKDRDRFKKRPDKPLGVVLERKASSGSTSRKAFG